MPLLSQTTTMADQLQQEQLQGVDIAKVLREVGPIVKCVLLRATRSNDDCKKKAAATTEESTDTTTNDLIEEIEMDTTPRKNEVEKILGGPFTFVGQYEEEGVMLMARRGWILDNPDDEGEEEEDNDTPPKHLLNPHKLQPPFHTANIYGDILVLKVAEVADPLDDNEQENTTAVPPTASNEEFFLNYTKESWLQFAARTDVVAPSRPVDDGPEEEEENYEEEEEEEVEGESDEDDDEPDEEGQAAMMQLLMTNVLKQFRERNGRGPSSEELLILRSTVAEKLGITLSGDQTENWDGNTEQDEQEEVKPESDETQGTKRDIMSDPVADDDESEPKNKKVKFGVEDTNDKAATILAQ
jgi:hypothetical protein